MKIYITELGEKKFAKNKWKTGQEINISDSIAKRFVEKGVATFELISEQKEKQPKLKTKKSK